LARIGTESEVSASPKVSTVAERTIPRLWRDAVAAKRTGAAYLVEAEPGRWREVSWDEAARTVEEAGVTA